MLSLQKDHEYWLNNYEESSFYSCEDQGGQCTTFHTLTPVLHDIGLLNSFREYRGVIQKVVSQILKSTKVISIAVVGIESESSAKSLVDSLCLFKGVSITVTFIDICSTPLNRIQACLERDELNKIVLKRLDILDFEKAGISGRFDVVFSDSFVKQFDFDRKNKVVRILSKLLNDKNHARIVAREYFGDIDDLLTKLWSIFKKRYAPWLSQISRQPLERLINDLDVYYKTSGCIYEFSSEFESDIIAAGLLVEDIFYSESKPDRIFVIGK